jgi:hypothetical protein
MLNVNQITSMLRRLQPDTALQEYAKANKDNPYIMALALSEAKRREKMKIAAQANAPEQPKVVDQAIQSMAAPMPEDIGIAQLPAGDMNFADGGIVAFDEGGPVERYQDRGLVRPVVYAEDPRLAREATTRARLYEYFRNLGRGPAGALPGAAGPAAALAAVPAGLAYGLTSAMDYTREMGMPVDPMGEFSSGAMTDAQIAHDAARRQEILRRQAAQRAENARLQAVVEGRPIPADAAAPNTPAAPAAAPPGTAAPDAGAGGPRQNTAGRRNLGAGAPPAAAAAPAAVRDPLIDRLMQPVTAVPVNFEPSQATFPTLEQIKKLYDDNRVRPEDVVDPFAEQRQELTNLAVLQNAQEQADFERRVKERGQLGEKQEARLKAREEKLGKQEKDLGPLAMLQAGFAIMSGSSRSALQNIGAGAQVGLRGYSEGLEKLQTARERIEDGLERIETARRSEGILNDQQRSALRREGNAIVRDGKKETINALSTELGVKRAEATALSNAGIKMLTDKAAAGSAERLGLAQIEAANIRAAREQEGAGLRTAAQLSTQERIALADANARKAEAGARRAEAERQGAAKSDQELREIYAKSVLLQQRYPDVNEYLRIMKGTAALQAGQQLSPADQALIQKYLKP